MLFSEPAFLVLFLPLLLWLYWLCPYRLRNALLAAASLIFYAWGERKYCVIMFASIVVNYAVGLGVDETRSPRMRRWSLIAGVAANLLLLAAFKYTNFIAENLNLLLEPLGAELPPLEPIHLPIGISFFTFQSISYVVDVYRGQARAQRNLVDTALFVSFFPQLIAGPIVRYRQIAEQIDRRVESLRKFQIGVKRFIFGFAKKTVIANAVAWPADQIFALPASELDAPLAWAGIACYTLQIYFDFSGYSEMAIGLGYMFGFRIPENFRYPYISRSITEFWRRWHMTLGSWYRDYLYIPLGGNRGSSFVVYRNLVIVFFLCGLWHGANWAFVVWGIFHGFFLVVERAGGSRVLRSLPRPLAHAYTLLVVMVGWVFFRIATGPPARPDLLGYSLDYLGAMVGLGQGLTVRSLSEYFTPYSATIAVLGCIVSTPVYRYAAAAWIRWSRRQPERRPALLGGGRAIEGTWVFGIFFWALIVMASDTYNPFIYFQF